MSGGMCAFCSAEWAADELAIQGNGAAVCRHCLELCRELLRAQADADDDDEDDGDSDEWVYDPEVDDYVKRPTADPAAKARPSMPPAETQMRCTFCGASSTAGARVIAGEHAQICAGCVTSVKID